MLPVIPGELSGRGLTVGLNGAERADPKRAVVSRPSAGDPHDQNRKSRSHRDMPVLAASQSRLYLQKSCPPSIRSVRQARLTDIHPSVSANRRDYRTRRVHAGLRLVSAVNRCPRRRRGRFPAVRFHHPHADAGQAAGPAGAAVVGVPRPDPDHPSPYQGGGARRKRERKTPPTNARRCAEYQSGPLLLTPAHPGLAMSHKNSHIIARKPTSC